MENKPGRQYSSIAVIVLYYVTTVSTYSQVNKPIDQ